MKFELDPGKYVLAVSGGVDSIVLLDILKKQPSLRLVIAHFNHGIREDSDEDELLVKQTAEKYGLPFEAGRGNLGPNTSEERARDARYKFLYDVQKKHKAEAIVTAHHEDDVIETAILNLLRGTGRRGLSAIKENPNILRPMMAVAKNEIVRYANKNNLKWREDATNKDTKYLRNYIRLEVVPKLTAEERKQFSRNINKAEKMNKIINQEIAKLSQNIIKGNSISRSRFASLPVEIANEVIMLLLRNNNLGEFDRRSVERLTVALRTAKPGSMIDINRGASLKIDKSEVHLESPVPKLEVS